MADIICGPNVISVFTLLKLPLRYATNNGIDKIVTVEMGEPGSKQTVGITSFIWPAIDIFRTQWYVQPIEGKPNVATITVGELPPKFGTPGFRREIGRRPDDVINSPLRGEWLFVPVEGEHGVFE